MERGGGHTCHVLDTLRAVALVVTPVDFCGIVEIFEASTIRLVDAVWRRTWGGMAHTRAKHREEKRAR